MGNERMLEELDSKTAKGLLEYRRRLAAIEREMAEERSNLQAELLLREKQLQKEREEREKLFEARERRLHEQQFKFEHELSRRREENADLRTKLEAEIADRETRLAEAERLLASEKERYTEENRRRLESKSRDYVKDALDSLEIKETQFQVLARVWGTLGAISLISGLGFFVWVSINTFETLPGALSWQLVVMASFKGLVGLALFAALSKYSYLFSTSYMRESLKNGDRRHAINFGKFYLETYGSAAEWTQIKEAFEHWNIDAPNSFAPSPDTQLDVTSLEKIASAVEEKMRKVSPLSQTTKG